MSTKRMTGAREAMLFALRTVIGWHFLYEGLAKVWTPRWTAAGFLGVSRWWFADIFHAIASSPTLMRLADQFVIGALMLVGISLILGLFTRLGCVLGGLLLLSFYLCNPPFISLSIPVPTEGQYLFVDKNLVELAALAVLFVFYCDSSWSLDALLRHAWKARLSTSATDDLACSTDDSVDTTRDFATRRRWMQGLAGLPVLGGFVWAAVEKKRWNSYEETNLVDAVTGATQKISPMQALSQLEGALPYGRIKDKVFSRVILGGNLLSGWAHARDLIYVSRLVKEYHTKQKIFETLLLAENCGINTLLTNPVLCSLIDEYWKRGIGKIQFISDCAGMVYDNGKHAMPFDEYLDRIRQAIDRGACACYIQGETADFYIENGHLDRLERALQLIEDQGLPVGIGAHRIETIKACVDAGFVPDFWMKTLHHHRYWSADHPKWNDNVYCYSPSETIAYMESLEQPWIAFKILAAGAIRPRDAFRYAFESGADFACVGMYDFQMVENVNLAVNVFKSDIERRRPWRSETVVV